MSAAARSLSTHRVVVAYDGTNYHGWQVQPEVDTVAGRFAQALAAVTGERPRLRAAGRTDAGVHAHGQVVAFELTAPIAPGALLRGCNAHLPSDISVLRARLAENGFDPRREAWRRTYRYLLRPARVMPSVGAGYAWQVDPRLEVGPMREAAAALIGTHDFAQFGSSPEAGGSTRRTLDEAAITVAGGIVRVEIRADAFLRGMLRNLVGALVLIGNGSLALSDFRTALARPASGLGRWRPAPAHGLHQWRVEYHRPAMLGVRI
ncbi:MAG: tRNA pseudouridine(38-40) synthase TruA [Candidatus Dormibacteria bacterium]